jgi:coenzyme PQQ precursor peptide PqqA
MVAWLVRTAPLPDHGGGMCHPANRARRLSMQWQTPQAVDLRFGFEITMYVAAR